MRYLPFPNLSPRRFDLIKLPGERFTDEPVEPPEPGPIHAYLFDPDPQLMTRGQRRILRQPSTAFLEEGAEEAACGMGVRVIYRRAFDTTEPDVCPRCVEMAELRQVDPAEFQRRIDERHELWDEREDRRYREFEEWDLARQESYGTDPIGEDE
jgi:hypothetical protein